MATNKFSKVCSHCESPFSTNTKATTRCSMRCVYLSLAQDPVARFWERVNKDGPNGCWLWTGSKFPNGYGQIWVDGTNISAHRFSWTIHNGPVPEGMLVCHHCDIRDCVNPQHFFVGSYADNAADKSQKGRQRGEAIGTSKLTEAQVAEIKGMTGTNAEIAALFGIDPTNVSMIQTGKTWRHVGVLKRAGRV